MDSIELVDILAIFAADRYARRVPATRQASDEASERRGKRATRQASDDPLLTQGQRLDDALLAGACIALLVVSIAWVLLWRALKEAAARDRTGEWASIVRTPRDLWRYPP